jgi:serine/threonine protein kinase
MSPTSFLNGGSKLESFFTVDDKTSVQVEGEIIRKASETKLKKYWYCLLGKELYVYKTKSDEKHKGMHNLIGVFIKDEPEEHLDSQTTLYPFKLIFPQGKQRVYYLQT